jgi:cytochrome c-type biogenesis protein CcmH
MITFAAILAAMTTAAVAAIVTPFLLKGRTDHSGSDIEVYRDQLKELERDREAELIDAGDAEAARVELSRRLLNTVRQEKATSGSWAPRSQIAARRLALIMALVTVPVGSAGLYLQLGSPGMRAGTAKTAGQQESQRIPRLIAQVEAHLRSNPDDGRGWEVLAPVYAKLGRYDESVRAWKLAIEHLGESAGRLDGLGESMVAAAGGVVTADARKVFDRAFALDNNAVAARYYSGLAAKQDGSPEQAAKIWREMIASAPPDAPWVGSVRAALAQVEPATDMSTAERLGGQNEFVQAMVQRLAERLKADGSDPEGWIRLVRSYKVLGETEKANAAIQDAKTVLAKHPDKLAQFEEGLQALSHGSAKD